MKECRRVATEYDLLCAEHGRTAMECADEEIDRLRADLAMQGATLIDVLKQRDKAEAENAALKAYEKECRKLFGPHSTLHNAIRWQKKLLAENAALRGQIEEMRTKYERR